MSFRNAYVAVLPALAVGAVLGVAACDGGDDPMQTTAEALTGTAPDAAPEAGSGGGAEPPAGEENEPAADPASDEAAIASTLLAVLADRNADAACAELVTPRYVRRSFGGERACRHAQAPGAAARRVAVSRTVVLPDSVAQAWVVPRGGVYDGQRLRAELVLTDGTWRLDSLRSNVPVGP